MRHAPDVHQARKRFGQNFLRDDFIIQRIVAAIAPQPGERIVEIGPGTGALTEGLLASNCQLDAIELDRDLIPGLLASFVRKPNFSLHKADALKFDFKALAAPGENLRIVGNLPYNIATPLIFKLLDLLDSVTDMHFMLQKEVVDRLAARPGSKAWGRLGIMTQYYCQVEALFEVPPTAFEPAPRVTSAVVRLRPRTEGDAWPPCNKPQLDKVVLQAFSQRRKTLRNNLKALIDADALARIGIDPGARAETLSIHQFIEITNACQ